MAGYITTDGGGPLPVPSRGFYTGSRSTPVRPAAVVGDPIAAASVRPEMARGRDLALPERTDRTARRAPAAMPQTSQPAPAEPGRGQAPAPTPRPAQLPPPHRPSADSGRRAGATATPAGKSR